MTNVNNVFYKTPELCDPTIENGDESCASVNGALFLHFYLIQKLILTDLLVEKYFLI